MSDYALLEASLSSKNYELLEKHLQPHALQSMTRELLKSLKEYHDLHITTGGTTTERDTFESWFFTTKHATSPEKKIDPYKFAFAKWNRLADAGSLETDVQVLLKTYVDLDVYTRILDLATKGAEGDPNITPDNISMLLDEYHATSINTSNPEAVDPYEVTTDITEFGHDILDKGLEWPLEELNISCGPLRQGNFVEVGAYPETGKTTFLSQMFTYMGPQLGPDDYIVWINNEERWQTVVERLYQSALGVSGRDIKKDPDSFKEKFDVAMGKEGRIRFLDSAVISVDAIDRFLARVKPKLIVIDMLDKVRGFEDSKRDDIRIQRLYQQGREWAKIYGPVVISSQADASASFQAWIRMDQLAGSKVAKQAEADAIITIGRKDPGIDPAEENVRYIHLPKNKLPGGDRSLESERYGRWVVNLEREIGRYKGQPR